MAPEDYKYSEFKGDSFMDAYIENRRAFMLKLGVGTHRLYSLSEYVTQALSRIQDESMSGSAEVIQLSQCFKLLFSQLNQESILTNPTMNQLIKYFEVHKKLFKTYRLPRFRKADDSLADLQDYILLACLCEGVYQNWHALKYLNTLLKLIDIFVSLPQDALLDNLKPWLYVLCQSELHHLESMI